MADATTEPRWRTRFAKMPREAREIRFPPARARALEQDEEWCEVVLRNGTRRIRFHDYHEVYKVRGLYEAIFYERLKCNSPSRVTRLLADVLRDFDEEAADLRVLDVGAGNGMVGEELHARGTRHLVGIDIIPEARQAAQRDRPEVYDDYYVADLTDLPEDVEEKLRKRKLNALTTVAALGFGDIPPKAFLKALDVIDMPGWLAFNIKEVFLHEQDPTGFCRLIRQLNRERIIQMQAYRRYRHRYSIHGRPLHYVAMVARKQADVPDHFMEE